MTKASQETLDGKVALVTGAARRIGAAIAVTLHAAGARIVVHYRGSRTEADELVASLNAVRADSATALRADLAADSGPDSTAQGSRSCNNRPGAAAHRPNGCHYQR